MEISMPIWENQFITISISISAMVMSTFNTVRITQLDAKITTLKAKTDLMLDVVHLHEKHLHHLDEKLEQTQALLADLLESNIWLSSKVTDAIEKKFQSIIPHHKNIVKSAQHHRLAPFIQYVLDLFQIEVSHLFPLLQTNSPWSNMFWWSPTTTCSICMSFSHFWSTSTLWPTSPSFPMSVPQMFMLSSIQSHFKLFPAQISTLACTTETPSFAREGKWWKQVWKDHV